VNRVRRYTEDNRTESNYRTGKSEAEVTNNKKNCARGIVLLKLTTDRHEASRGLFATAELLVRIVHQGGMPIRRASTVAAANVRNQHHASLYLL